MSKIAVDGLDAVIFDVGGVLVESPFVAAYRWGQELDLPMEAFLALYEEYSRVPAPGEPVPMWHQIEMGHRPLQDFVELMQQRFSAVLPADHPGRSVSADDFNFFASASLLDPIMECVDLLSAAGLKVGILTNNVREWWQWREVVPVAVFDDVIDSCEVGLRKPDPAIFDLACSRLEVAPDRALFLDDQQGNVDGARRVGLSSMLVSDDLVPITSVLRDVAAARSSR